MLKFLRLKHKAPGLGIIIGIGALQSFLPLYPFFDKPSLLRNTFQDWERIAAILRLPILFFLLWLACFMSVKCAQEKKLHLPFFEKFNAWKGVAVLMLWPALILWWRLLTNYHQALDFLHPFTTLAFAHVMFIFFSLIFLLLLLFPSAKKKKHSEAINNLLKDMGPNLLWGRFFLREVGSDPLGKVIAYFSGVSYLVFFYLLIMSLASPEAWAVTTEGNTLTAYKVDYIWASKYGSHTGSYCVLDIRTEGKTLEFALNTCQPCAQKLGAKVIVTHHPLDYRNRRISSVACVEK